MHRALADEAEEEEEEEMEDEDKLRNGRRIEQTLLSLEKGLLHGHSLKNLACTMRKFFREKYCHEARDRVHVLHVLEHAGHYQARAHVWHVHIYRADTSLRSRLVSTCVDVESVSNAHQVFDRLPSPSGLSWDSLINKYFKCAKHHLALTMYQTLPKDNSAHFNGHTLVSLLKACVKGNDLELGVEIHEYASRSGLLERDLYVGSSLIDMYIKCGSLVKAEQLLNELPVRNVVSWATLIAGYVDHGHSEKALKCLKRMQSEGVPPNAFTFVCCLKACCSLGDPSRNEEVHAEIERHGLRENIFVGTTLVDMYAKCGSLLKAQQVFEKLLVRNVVSWTALIAGYSENGHGEKALECYEYMLLEGVVPNAVTYVCSLKACGIAGAIAKGQELHASIEKQGMLEQDIMIGVTLVDMYAKCGLLAKAQQVFDKVHCRNVVLWNALIAGYAEHGHGERALTCFEQMQSEGISPDAVTFLCSLKACGSIKALAKGQEIHFEVERQGLVEEDLAIANTLVDMYAKCGSLGIAELVFDKLPTRNIVSWNALIAGYAEHGPSEKVIELFERMQHENILPDSVSYLCGLKACGTVEAMDKGRELLAQVIRQSPLERDFYVGSTLVNVYAKCGSFAKAKEVFDELPVRDVVSWNALVAGYAEHGRGEDVLKYLDQMQFEGFSPNAVTFICSLKACGSIGAIDKGQDIHAEIERRGMLDRELVGNTLVDMYAKCSVLSMAQQVFENLQVQDVVSWTALMAGYGQLGKSNIVFHMFDRMVGMGVKPNPVTLVVVLSACNRTCLFNESRSYFETMSNDYGVVPTIKHHACVIDLFGRAGHLENAISMVKKMPFSPNLVVWHIMLGACKGFGNAELGNGAFEHAVHSDERDSAASILMSQL